MADFMAEAVENGLPVQMKRSFPKG